MSEGGTLEENKCFIHFLSCKDHGNDNLKSCTEVTYNKTLFRREEWLRLDSIGTEVAITKYNESNKRKYC